MRRVLLPLAAGALLLAPVLLAPVTAQEDDGGGFLERQIEQRLSGPGFQVQISGFEGALSSRATIAQLVLSDDEGPWLTLNDAVLDWNRSALLRGRLEVEELSAAELIVPRRPVPDDSIQVPDAEAKPFSLPDLPVSVRLDRLAIERVELGEPLFGAAAVVSLEGSASLADGEGAVDLAIDRVDGQAGAFRIAGSYANDDQRVAIDLSVEEAADGIVANLADLPGRPSVALSVQGEGPLSDFTADIDLATDGEPRLVGAVTIADADGARGFDVDLSGDIAPVFTPQYRPFFGPDVALKAAGAQFPDGRLTVDALSVTAQSLTLEGSLALGADGLPDSFELSGAIASGDGPVLLPFGATETRVDRIAVDVAFDAAQSDDWTGALRIAGLDRAEFAADEVVLDGSGVIADGEPRAVTADFRFAATGLNPADDGVRAALGTAVQGDAAIRWTAGAPVLLDRLTLEGATFRLAGSGQIDPTAEGIPASLSAQLDAADIAAFSTLAGRDLSGSASLNADVQAAVTGASFDVSLDGTADDLGIGIAQVDPLLAGRTVLTVRADRDATGTRLSEFTVANPATRLSAEADLTSEASTAQAAIGIADLSVVDPALSGAATLALDAVQEGAAWRVDLVGDGTGAAIDGDVALTLPEDAAPFVTGSLDVTAADIDRFSGLAGRTLGGSLQVTVNGSGSSDLAQADVAVTGTLNDLEIGQEIVDNLLAGETSIDLDLTKDSNVVALPRLTIENPQIAANGTARYEVGNNALDLDVTMPDLAQVVPRLDGPASLTAKGVQDGDVWRVIIDGAGADATLAAQAAVTDLGLPVAMVDGAARIAASNIARFRALAGGREIGGALDLAVEGQARIDLTSADVTLDGTLTDLAVGQEQADNLLDGTTTLSAQVVKDGVTVTVPTLSVANPQITVDGDARYAPLDNALDLSIALPDLSQVVPTLDGPARADVTGVQQGEIWAVTLDAAGAGATATGAVDVAALGQSEMFVDGEVAIAATDLARFRPLAGRDIGGGVDVTVRGSARTDLSSLDATVDGILQDLAVGQAEADNLLAGRTTLSAAVRKDGSEIRLPSLSVSNPQIVATAEGAYGTGEDALRAEVNLPDLSDIASALTGSGTLDLTANETGDDLWEVALSASGSGAEVDADATVDAPFAPERAVDGTVSVRAEDLSRFRQLAGRPLSGTIDATATGSGRTDGSRFDVAVDATGQGVVIGQAQADSLLAGSLTLELEASRDGPREPVTVERLVLDTAALNVSASGQVLGGQSDLDLTARLADLGPFVPGINGPVTVEGSLREAGADIGVALSGTGPAGITAQVDGTLSQGFDRANLDIGGTVPLALANQFIAPRALEGTARLDLALNGPLAVQSLSGRVTAAGGRIVAPELGIVLGDVAATVTLGNNAANLDITAMSEGGGRLAVGGPISLAPGYGADLAVRLDGFVAEDPRLYRTTVDGTVTVQGPLTGGARIGGRLDLVETEVRIPSTGLGATGPIPDGLVHVNEPADVRQTRSRADLIEEPGGGGGGGGAAFPLDLLIVADSRIFVRGRGLDAELGGRLQLSGSTANVVPSGQFDLIRGRLDLLGQRLALNEGNITLQGDFTPFIRLVAETDQNDVVILIVVEGPALEPEIDFLSQPELPEDEVLARLLFGRSVDEISPLQAAQLASAVATLAGRGGDGIVSRLRDSFGLDDLDVTTDADGNVALRAGAYLSENVYTDVTVGAEGEARINLNLDVTDSVTVRGGTSSGGDASLGVFFERDY